VAWASEIVHVSVGICVYASIIGTTDLACTYKHTCPTDYLLYHVPGVLQQKRPCKHLQVTLLALVELEYLACYLYMGIRG
jgi:hypothetical protein